MGNTNAVGQDENLLWSRIWSAGNGRLTRLVLLGSLFMALLGCGTSWVHQWYLNVPLTAGRNMIQINAFDPSGKGGSITQDVYY